MTGQLTAPKLNRKLFGDRWRLAIEIETHDAVPSISSWGSTWLWVDGILLGNPNAVEQLGIGIGWLKAVASRPRPSLGPHFDSLTPSEKIQHFSGLFRGHCREVPQRDFSDKDIAQLEYQYYGIVDASAGPAFDYWTILFLEGDPEFVIWQPPDSTTAFERQLPNGVFRSLVGECWQAISGSA